MSSLNNLEIASSIYKDTRIKVNKSLFGFKTTIIYNPTQSPLRIIKKECSALTGKKLEHILNAQPDEMCELVKSFGKFQDTTLGQYLLEALISSDKQFAALCLYRYTDMDYKPITKLITYEGEQAEIINTIF